MYLHVYVDDKHCMLASLQEVEKELAAVKQQSEKSINQLTSDKQTLQEKLTKMSFDNSSMKEQLREASSMVIHGLSCCQDLSPTICILQFLYVIYTDCFNVER